jgi:hypothetical protein
VIIASAAHKINAFGVENPSLPAVEQRGQVERWRRAFGPPATGDAHQAIPAAEGEHQPLAAALRIDGRLVGQREEGVMQDQPVEIYCRA